MFRLLVICAILLFVPTAQARDKSLPNELTLGSERLMYNGSGIAKRFMLKIYNIGLYTQNPCEDRGDLLRANEIMAVRMRWIYKKIPPNKLVSAWNWGFDKLPKQQTRPIQEHIEQFNALFTAPAHADDIYDLVYYPDKGVSLYINGHLKGRIDGGVAFKQALFGIWFHDRGVLSKVGASICP